MISCEKHDYIEIACLYRLPVALEMCTGELITGTASDLRLNDSRQECLVLESLDGELMLVLDKIKQMRALKANPHFDIVILSD